jgi:hypothetical protein
MNCFQIKELLSKTRVNRKFLKLLVQKERGKQFITSWNWFSFLITIKEEFLIHFD